MRGYSPNYGHYVAYAHPLVRVHRAVPPRVQARPRRHRIEAPGLALPFWALARLGYREWLSEIYSF
jgi:hypothetical protein